MANTVEITGNLNDDDSKQAPYDLEVSYTADRDGLEVYIDYHGYAVDPQNAPEPNGNLTFHLNWAGSTQNETVRAILRVKATPSTHLDSNARHGLLFDTGGPPVARPKIIEDAKAVFSHLEFGAKPKGNELPATCHSSHFGPMDQRVPFAHVRILIQGKRTEGQHKLFYDLPAGPPLWVKKDGKWYAHWLFCPVEPLSAGDGLETLVRPVLLDATGKVLRITTYPI